jgi:hypothetical protein
MDIGETFDPDAAGGFVAAMLLKDRSRKERGQSARSALQRRSERV